MDPKAFTFTEHLDIFRANLDGPTPMCLQKFDEAFGVLLSQLDYIEGFSSAKMFVAAQTSLRTANIICKSGAVPQSIPLLRHAIECAIYGFAFKFDRDFYRDWKLRETDNKAKLRMKRLHSIRSKIRQIDQKNPALRSKVERQYEMLLSLGAHPNGFQIDGNIDFVFEHNADDGLAKISIFGDDKDRVDGCLIPAYSPNAALLSALGGFAARDVLYLGL